MNRFQIFFQILAAVLIGFFSAQAIAGVSGSLESLGNNETVVKKAEGMKSSSRVAIVQGRTVKRDWRVELGTNYGAVAAGDSYLNTQNLGAQLDLHVNPRFSLGLRYAKAYNQLTTEGRKRFEEARTAKANGVSDYRIPDLDYPEESLMGVVNWYMMYGKINFFDLSVVQFDLYSLAGYGQMKLASGPAPTWTAGGGIGFWLTQHISSRFELRYQTYQDQVYSGSRDLNLIIGTFGLGVLL